MLKSYGVGGGGGLEQISVSPRPLCFGFGIRVWGQGLTILLIIFKSCFHIAGRTTVFIVVYVV